MHEADYTRLTNKVRTRCSYQTTGSYLEQESKQLNCFASDIRGLSALAVVSVSSVLSEIVLV